MISKWEQFISTALTKVLNIYKEQNFCIISIYAKSMACFEQHIPD